MFELGVYVCLCAASFVFLHLTADDVRWLPAEVISIAAMLSTSLKF